VLPGAPSGRYDIWVGTYGENTAAARLLISEIDPRGRSSAMGVNGGNTGNSGNSGTGIDRSLEPHYGFRTLNGGFVPDPNVVELQAGGSQQVSVPGCSVGWVSRAPDVKLQYNGNNSRTLFIYTASSSDVTLLVNMPDGSWRCDDDTGGNAQALLELVNAPSGLYDIWVGTFSQGSMQPARLLISEIRPR
jgi:serine protease Do